MIKTNDNDENLYYLGAICKNNHVFSNTNQSLRQKSNRTCVVCQKYTNLKYKQANLQLCNERTNQWRKNIAQRLDKILPHKKQCNVCGELKITQSFYQVKYSADGLLGHCKSCDKQRQRDSRTKRRKPKVLKDPELIKENRRLIKKRYKKSVKGKLANTLAQHRRKAKMMMIKLKIYSPTQLLTRFAEFGNECVYCESKERISIDHFIPVSKFGADCLENIVPACVRCNSSKNNRDPQLWFKSQTFYSDEKWQILTEKVSTANFNS
jgi:5-methylcytosine-specific restriction endonuclease McrA